MSDDNFRLKNIEVNMEKIDIGMNTIVSMLNGKKGIITTLELHEQTMKNIPTPNALKCYAAVGGGITSALSIIAWALFSIFKHA